MSPGFFGLPTSTGELAGTFLASLGLLLTIAAVWLVMIVGAVFAAALFVIVAGTWLCRFASIPLGRLSWWSRGLPRRVMRMTGRHVAWVFQWMRRRPAGWLGRLAAAVVGLGILCYVLVAAGLVSLILVVLAIGFLNQRIASIHQHCRGLERTVVGRVQRVRDWRLLRHTA